MKSNINAIDSMNFFFQVRKSLLLFSALLLCLLACERQPILVQQVNQAMEQGLQNELKQGTELKPEITISDISQQVFHQYNPTNITQIADALYYLKNGNSQLYRFQIKDQKEELLLDADEITTNKALSEAQKMVLERLRQSSENFLKMTQMNQDHLMLIKGSDIIVYQISSKKHWPLNFEHQPIHLTFDSAKRKFTYHADQGLWLQYVDAQMKLDGNAILMTPQKKQPYQSYGEAEFIAQEEMERSYGYAWSANSEYLAYTLVDDSEVALQTRMSLSAEGNALIEQKYPATGTANAKVKLFVAKAPNSKENKKPLKPVALAVPEGMEYLTRFEFGSNHRLWMQWQSRDQKTLKLYEALPPKFELTEVLTESSETWVDLHDDFIEKEGYLIWASSCQGVNQLFAIDLKNKKRIELTSPKAPVLHIAFELNNQLYFYKSTNQGLDKQLFVIDLPILQGKADAQIDELKLDGFQSNERQVTQVSGHHQISYLDRDYFLHTFSNISTPPQQTLIHAQSFALDNRNQPTIDSKSKAVIPISQLNPKLSTLSKPKIEYKTIPAKDGSLLNAIVYYPIGYQEGQKYPTLAYGYAGPTSQTVTNAWNNSNHLLWLLLSHHQYIVYSVDNRGTPNRDQRFSHAMYQQIGKIEVEDHITAARWMIENIKGVDAQRMGVYGWSYGGYLTGLLLTEPNHPFKAGISVAPVSDWKLYDTHYTERYMGTPQSQKSLYEKSSLVYRTPQFKGNLLLAHGMSDDNVLFDHSLMWIAALQKQGILFELMTYPGDGHAINKGNHRNHLYHTMFDFLERKLKK